MIINKINKLMKYLFFKIYKSALQSIAKYVATYYAITLTVVAKCHKFQINFDKVSQKILQISSQTFSKATQIIVAISVLNNCCNKCCHRQLMVIQLAIQSVTSKMCNK